MSRKKLLKLENLDDFIPLTIGDRINYVQAKTGLSGAKFCKEIDISTGNLNGLINDDSLPSSGLLARILEKYSVNINWVLTGKGPKYLQTEPEIGEDMDFTKEELLKIIDLAAGYQKEIRDLKDDINKLKEAVVLLKQQCQLTHQGLDRVDKHLKNTGTHSSK